MKILDHKTLKPKTNPIMNHNWLIDYLPTVEVDGLITVMLAQHLECTSQKTLEGSSFSINGKENSPAFGIEVLGDSILDEEHGPTVNGWELKINGLSWDEYCFVRDGAYTDENSISDLVGQLISVDFADVIFKELKA